MLTLENISLSRNNKKLFNRVNFSLTPGAIYILRGPNGCGKTSLLKIISRVKDASSGRILWNNEVTEKHLYHRYIAGFLAHENAVKNNLSVYENLILWAKLKETQLLLPAAINQFQLDDYINIKCKHISAGLRKRVALARMILSDTELWLLDEPETNLDEFGMNLLLKLLQGKINAGGMVLIASHNKEIYNKIPIINLEDFKYDC